MEQIKNFVASIDPKILYAVAIIAVILIVISLIKKAVKFVLFLAIIAVAFFALAPASSSIRQQFNIETNDGALIITVQGEEHTVADIKDIHSVNITELEDGGFNLNIQYGEDGDIDVNLPKATKVIVEKTLDKMDIPYTETE